MRLGSSDSTLVVVLAATTTVVLSIRMTDAFTFLPTYSSTASYRVHYYSTHVSRFSTACSSHHPYSSYYGNPTTGSSSNNNQQQQHHQAEEGIVNDDRYSFGPPSGTAGTRNRHETTPTPTFEAYFQERQRQQQQAQHVAATATTTTTSSVLPTTNQHQHNPTTGSSNTSSNTGKAPFRVLQDDRSNVNIELLPHPLPTPPITSFDNNNSNMLYPTGPPRRQPPPEPSSTIPQQQQPELKALVRPYAAGREIDEPVLLPVDLPVVVPQPLSSPLDMYNQHRLSTTPKINEDHIRVPNLSTSTTTTMSTTSTPFFLSTAIEERLDKLSTQNKEFLNRLDIVEQKVDQQPQELMDRTQTLLSKFRQETQQTNEKLWNTVTSDIQSMKTKLNQVWMDQQALSKTQQEQSNQLQQFSKTQTDHKEQLTTLEKTQNIRMTNMEKSQIDSHNKQTETIQKSIQQSQQSSQQQQEQRLQKMSTEMQQDTNRRIQDMENTQVDRMNAFEELQTTKLNQAMGTFHTDIQRTIQQQQEENELKQQKYQREHNMGPTNDDRPGNDNMNRRSSPPKFVDDHDEDQNEYHNTMNRPDNDEEEHDDDLTSPPQLGMLRDRLMQQGGRANLEQLYHQQQNIMKQDPVKPQQPMGPDPRNRKMMNHDSHFEERRRRGGPRDYPKSDEEETDHETVQALGKYRSHPGDEPLPSNPLGNTAGSTTMGRFQRGPSDSNPSMMPRQRDIGSSNAAATSASSTPNNTKQGLPPPPNTPLVDRKLDHFLQETMNNGPKDYFDKEMENLLMEKYRPMYPWLKITNVQFLRSVLTTFLEHSGAQVEMDLREASEQASFEWEELMTILRMELLRITGDVPRIQVEGDNQWGIYKGKNASSSSHNNTTRQPPASTTFTKRTSMK